MDNRSDLKQAGKEIVKQAGKEIVKQLIIKKVLVVLAPLIPYLLGIFVVFVAAFVVLGLLSPSASAAPNESTVPGSIAATYAYCESVNVNGNIIPLDTYVAGVVQNNTYAQDKEELLKAQTVVARTYALSITNGCSSAINSSTLSYSTPTENGKAMNAAKSTSGVVIYKDNKLLSNNYESICTSDADCGEIIQLIQTNGTYEQILNKFYTDSGNGGIELKSIKTNSSIDTSKGYNSSYTHSKNGKTYLNYKQCSFDVEWLCNYGCGLTSTSIIISGNNKQITPTYLYNNYRVPDGSVNMGKYFSNYLTGNDKFVSKSVKVSSMKAELINHMKNGGSAVFFIKKANGCYQFNGEDWTKSQHYFTALDYDSTSNKVYISNPGTNKNSQNGWISLDTFNCAIVVYLVY